MKSFTTARRHLSVFLATAHFLFWESTFAWYSPVNSRSLRPLASTPLRLPNIHAKSTSSSNEEKRLFFTLFSKATPQPSSAKAIDKGDSSARVNNRLQKTRRSENFKKQNSIKMMFRKAKTIERQGRWKEALNMFQAILEIAPLDAYSHLALARLEARREPKVRAKGKQLVSGEDDTFTTDSVGATSKARAAFETGTMACPNSVHLWQAWAVYEDSRGKFSKARDLFQDALSLDPYNSHVCHAYGLMEKKLGNETKARDLFERALSKHSTAALVCSLGEILIFNGEFKTARDLYAKHLQLLKVEKDRIEVYLASAWLEERYLHNYTRAQELLQSALSLNPSSSLANVALARLEGRMQRRSNKKGLSGNKATKKRLVSVCNKIENSNRRPSDPTDGRVFNALASLHVKSHRYDEACSILRKGMELYPLDHAMFQAAGKVEERLGNFTGARELYTQSLHLQPSAPTLVAFAMLELFQPESKSANFTKVKGLFEEALLLDPRHGPAYNAYGNIEFKSGNIDSARAIFERGVSAECSDAASLYHGYGKFELSLGNVDAARSILEKGLGEVRMKGLGTDSTHRDRSKFLSHTLGMLELNSNRPVVAREVFQEGINRSGNSSQLLLGAALCEMKLGKENAARALFERSILSDKKHAQAWQAWGVMETRAGNFKTASTLFQCGLKSAPKNGPLWHGFASLESKKGNTQNARILFAGGLKKAPHHIPLYQNWALLELREGNYEVARKLISEALTLNKQNGAGWLIAAQIEEEQGNKGLVSLLLRRGIECAPNDAELYRKLGERLVSQGKIEDAREVFEKGIEMNPLHALLYHSLAELEARVFNLDGLSRLKKRTSDLFNANALEPAPSSSQAFGSKIRSKRSRHLPSGIAALAEKIVDDVGDGSLFELGDIEKLDPISTLESMTGSFMEDDYVDDLLSIDPITDS